MILYTKLNSISRPTVIKYSNLVTSFVENRLRSLVNLLMVIITIQVVYERNLCSNKVLFPQTILDNFRNTFIAGHQ